MTVRLCRGGGCRFERDLVAHALELADKTLLVGLLGLAVDEVVRAQVAVGLAALEQVVGDHEDGVADRDGGLLRAAPSADVTCV